MEIDGKDEPMLPDSTAYKKTTQTNRVPWKQMVVVLLCLFVIIMIIIMSVGESITVPTVAISSRPRRIRSDDIICFANTRTREAWLNKTFIGLTSRQTSPVTTEGREELWNSTCSNRLRSFFEVVDADERFELGGCLTVKVSMRDGRGRPKLYGGDFVVGRLYNDELHAAVSASVHDAGDGSYLLSFPLLWSGKAFVSVRLLHSSEAVSALNFVRESFPGKIAFRAVFRRKGQSETTNCFMNNVENLNVTDRADGHDTVCILHNSKLCEPLMCIKPKNYNCESLQHLFSYNYDATPWGDEYQRLFEREKDQQPLKAQGPSNISVIGNKVIGAVPQCGPVVPLRPSGYYFNNKWNPMGTTLKDFKYNDVVSCLRGRQVLFFGDSTIVQWWNHLTSMVYTLHKIDLHIKEIHRPFLAIDKHNNITLSYFPHAYPFICAKLQRAKDFNSCANAIAKLQGGRNTVVALSLGAHFAPFPLRVFLARIFIIREAVIRLLNRKPGTAIVIKLVNTRELTLDFARFSNWFPYQFNEALRVAFQDIKGVGFVDSWDMTASLDSYMLHADTMIVGNQINVFLNHVC